MLNAMFRDFRPRFWPSVISGVGVATLLALGTWQLFRMVEKREINSLRAERLAVVVTALPPRLDDPATWEFRRVAVRGQLNHARELYLPCRSQRGNDGTCVLVPLMRAEGLPVLVNRGWVPPERKDPARRPDAQQAGEVSFDGVLRVSQQRTRFMPDNDPGRNVWFAYDLPAMAKALGVAEFAPFYIESTLDPRAPPTAPIGGQTRFQLPDNHLGYAFTWFALALALAIIFVLSQRQESKR